jgi:hypothetical protein
MSYNWKAPIEIEGQPGILDRAKNIEQLTLQLLVKSSSRCHAQSAYEFLRDDRVSKKFDRSLAYTNLEFYCAGLVLIEDLHSGNISTQSTRKYRWMHSR